MNAIILSLTLHFGLGFVSGVTISGANPPHQEMSQVQRYVYFASEGALTGAIVGLGWHTVRFDSNDSEVKREIAAAALGGGIAGLAWEWMR